MAHLFVGGPHDGQIRGVDVDRQMIGLPDTPKISVTAFDRNAPAPAMTSVKWHTYYRMQFSGIERKVTVYAHEKLNPDDVLDAFIRNYRPEAQRLHDLLKLVQSDPGNWLHSDLQDAIVAAVGEDPPYRSVEDSGLVPAEPGS